MCDRKLQQQADKQGKDCDSILAQTVEDDVNDVAIYSFCVVRLR